MDYTTKKVGEGIIHIPDRPLEMARMGMRYAFYNKIVLGDPALDGKPRR